MFGRNDVMYDYITSPSVLQRKEKPNKKADIIKYLLCNLLWFFLTLLVDDR
jgi:hypothetical protein